MRKLGQARRGVLLARAWLLLPCCCRRRSLRLPDNHHSPHWPLRPTHPTACLCCCSVLAPTFTTNTRSRLRSSIPASDRLPRSSHSSAFAVPCRNTQPRRREKHRTQCGTTPPTNLHDGLRRLHNAMRKGVDTTVRPRGPPGNQRRRRHTNKVLCTND